MPDLERTLHELAAATEFPPTPDLARRVVAHAAPSPARPWRRAAAVALAAVVAAVAVAFAVPAARSAILRWLGIGSVQVERVPALPRIRLPRAADLGARTSLAGAERAAGFRLATLPREPDAVYVARIPRGRDVTLVYGHVLLEELRGRDAVFAARKLLGPRTRVEDVDVDGAPGIWITGAPHHFGYLDRDGRFEAGRVRLAGDTLLWQRGPVVLRVEGARTKAVALALARSVR
jgi:hypothetical protein